MKQMTIAVITLIFSSIAAASAVDNEYLKSASLDIQDTASLQRGARLFFTYCTSCHGAKYMRYERMAEDLELSEEDIRKNMMRSDTKKMSETIRATMPAEIAEKSFGIAPPDLSLEASYRGADWVYSYLVGFYEDETRPIGYNNHLLPNVAMPWILASYQKTQGEERFDADMQDLTNFMVYIAEPIKPFREKYGIYVLLFFLVLLIPVWLLKKEYWKDIH